MEEIHHNGSLLFTKLDELGQVLRLSDCLWSSVEDEGDRVDPDSAFLAVPARFLAISERS